MSSFFLPYFLKPTSKKKSLKLKNVLKSPKIFLSKEIMSINLLLILASFVRKNVGHVANLEGLKYPKFHFIKNAPSINNSGH